MELAEQVCSECGEDLRLNQTDVNIQVKCLGIHPESLLCLGCLEERHQEKWQEHFSLLEARHKLGVAKEARRRAHERQIQKRINRTLNGRW